MLHIIPNENMELFAYHCGKVIMIFCTETFAEKWNTKGVSMEESKEIQCSIVFGNTKQYWSFAGSLGELDEYIKGQNDDGFVQMLLTNKLTLEE
jgi:hypothetical protein